MKRRAIYWYFAGELWLVCEGEKYKKKNTELLFVPKSSPLL